MKLLNASTSNRAIHILTLSTALAIVAITVGCSKNASETVSSSLPAGASLRADTSQTGTMTTAPALMTAAPGTKALDSPSHGHNGGGG